MELILGVPKEIKTLEKRVGLTPEGVYQLAQQGVKIWVQNGAGVSSGFRDEAYEAAGARLLRTAEELYGGSQIILKVKEPLPSEFVHFRPGMILFSFLHLAAPSACDLVRALASGGVTALAFETLEKEGRRPLLTAMSEIAGALSSLFAGYFMQKKLLQLDAAGIGLLASGMEKIGAAYPEVLPGVSTSSSKFIVFGGGIAGESAARFALRIGGSVIIVEKNRQRCEQLAQIFNSEAGRFQVFSMEQLPPALLKSADVWIGSVHQTGKRAVQVVDRALMETACRENPKIIMDISIDQGGNFPEAIPTSYEDPLYRDSWGNGRFCVPNIPSLAGPFASEKLTALVLPYMRALAHGFDEALKICPELVSSVNVSGGEILLEGIRDAHGL